MYIVLQRWAVGPLLVHLYWTEADRALFSVDDKASPRSRGRFMDLGDLYNPLAKKLPTIDYVLPTPAIRKKWD